MIKQQTTTPFSLISLGCARTLVDSEKMVDSLQNSGFSLVQEGSGESITILNTCSFIQSAIDETESNIIALSERKRQGALKYLVVSGCYTSRFKKPELKEKFPEVDLWLSTSEEDQVHTQLSEMVFNRKFQPSAHRPYIKLTPSHYAYIKISEGCNNWCSFCTIPKIRGVHTSKSIEEIQKEIALQASFGVKEILLIAEDTTAWGEDLYGKPAFSTLLKSIGALDIPWVRPMYIFPARVDDALITTLATTQNICHYLDMPVQHINSDLLKAMNRAHDQDHLETIIQKLFKQMPDLALRTSLILGFPGETDAHFDQLVDFVERVPFAHIGCFAYSLEKETKSARMADPVPANVTRKRIATLMMKQKKLVESRNKQTIGQIVEVLYEGNGIARSYKEAPDVDGCIKVKGMDHCKPGQFYSATITGAKGYDRDAVFKP